MRLKYLFTTLLIFIVTLSASAFQVVITEIMADPDPAILLPPEEFIELTNVSGKTVDISAWQLSNGRTRSKFPDSIYLAADSFLIICASRNASKFMQFGRTIGLSRFPALSNENDTMLLYNALGEKIHAVAYSGKQYTRELPPGGRSLEMISLQKWCSLQNNWGPSKAATGGTPGKANSLVNTTIPDQKFTLLYAYCSGDSSIILVFDDAIDQASISRNNAIQSDPLLQFTTLTMDSMFGNQLTCRLARPLPAGQLMEIGADGIKSCLNEAPGGIRRVKVGLPDTGTEKLVINEILFDPPPEGADYVELYNGSNKVINLQQLRIANRNNTGEVSSEKNLSNTPRYIYPGDYMAFTSNADWIEKHYLVIDPAKIVSMEVLPSWPNDHGDVVLLSTSGAIIDELNYSAEWHFELIRNQEGVALERKNPAAKTQDPLNWFSAAMHAGYGTPGYVNSQLMTVSAAGHKIWVEPEFFSPNGDGIDEVCQLKYRFDQTGFVMNTTIFNRTGMPVRTLVNNALCGSLGSFAWDGKDDKKNQLPPGIYIVVTEVFTINGLVRKNRLAVTVGY